MLCYVIYYVHLLFKDMEDDLNRIVDFPEDDFNRIVDFLINFWVSFQISFLNFIIFYVCFWTICHGDN